MTVAQPTIAVLFQPVDGLIHDSLTRVTLGFPERFSVADEVYRILVAGLCIVPGAKPVIERRVRTELIALFVPQAGSAAGTTRRLGL